MGVLGLVPFLQKHYPHVIRSFDDRFRAFQGKTIILDGTLITHRFHFSLIPHHYRHIYGWFKLISELKKNEIQAICVFDGVRRSRAKLEENRKRRFARQKTALRGSMEIERQRRLNELNSLLKQRQNPLNDERSIVNKIVEGTAFQRQYEPRVSNYSDTEYTPKSLAGQTYRPTATIPKELYVELDSPHLHRGDMRYTIDHGDTISDDISQVPMPNEDAPPGELLDKFNKLYESYKSSMPQEKNVYDIDAMGVPSESKLQLELTEEESKLWADAEVIIRQPDECGTKVDVTDLVQRSQLLSEGYEKRSKPPTQETYAECKILLEALGLPYLDCGKDYEAEGLASSLVRHGYGDMVASEDTDVLLYGAPLLRNVTARDGPLTLLSPTEIRQALGFSRNAFIDYCVLLGTDFSDRLYRLGPVRATEFIRAHNRIEKVLDTEKRYAPTDEQLSSYLAQVKRARKIFHSLPQVPRNGRRRFESERTRDFKNKLRQKDVDQERITELLDRFNLTRALATDATDEWDTQGSLGSNYFSDNPFGEGTVVLAPGIPSWGPVP